MLGLMGFVSDWCASCIICGMMEVGGYMVCDEGDMFGRVWSVILYLVSKSSSVRKELCESEKKYLRKLVIKGQIDTNRLCLVQEIFQI